MVLDIINLIVLELRQTEDFGTLFKIAQCSHHFATLALAALYRIQHASPIKTSNEPDVGARGKTASEQSLQTKKWSSLWRSIMLSTKGHTIFPYSLYVRVLDLQDLVLLLEDLNFKYVSLRA